MSGLKKEKETSISELIQEFKRISLPIEEKYRVSVQLVRISGRRWSYIAGKETDNFSLAPAERIRLNEKLGVVVYGRENTPLNRQEILNVFKKLTGKMLLG